MKDKAANKSAIIQASLVLFGTFGIIVPLAVLLLPSTGNISPALSLIPGGEQNVIARPPKSRLSFYLRGLNQLSLMAKTSLRPSQLSRLNSILTPWLQRPTMTDRDAQRLQEKIEAILTQEQRSLMNEWQVAWGSYSPPPLSNDWQGRAIQEFRDTYNPFYPPFKHRLFSLLPPEMQERHQMRYDERRALLKQWRDNSKGFTTHAKLRPSGN